MPVTPNVYNIRQVCLFLSVMSACGVLARRRIRKERYCKLSMENRTNKINLEILCRFLVYSSRHFVAHNHVIIIIIIIARAGISPRRRNPEEAL